MQEGGSRMIDYDTYHRFERKEIDWDKYYQAQAEREDREYQDSYKEEED